MRGVPGGRTSSLIIGKARTHSRVATAVLSATRTLLRSYQQPDAETVRQVVLHPTQRIVSR